jgi:cytochrome b6-f complex iron-sulfur subunit
MARPELDRRDLLRVICGSAGALCGATACGVDSLVGKEQLAQLPAVVAGRISIPLAEFPVLREVGGGLVGQAPGMNGEPLAIARESDTRFVAMRALCTHMTCTLRYNQLNVTLDCPCHGSSFEIDGRVITGPAVRPLTMLATEFDGQTETLGILLQPA